MTWKKQNTFFGIFRQTGNHRIGSTVFVPDSDPPPWNPLGCLVHHTTINISSENVGIGTSPNALCKLNVGGTINATGLQVRSGNRFRIGSGITDCSIVGTNARMHNYPGESWGTQKEGLKNHLNPPLLYRFG